MGTSALSRDRTHFKTAKRLVRALVGLGETDAGATRAELLPEDPSWSRALMKKLCNAGLVRKERGAGVGASAVYFATSGLKKLLEDDDALALLLWPGSHVPGSAKQLTHGLEDEDDALEEDEGDALEDEDDALEDVDFVNDKEHFTIAQGAVRLFLSRGAAGVAIPDLFGIRKDPHYGWGRSFLIKLMNKGYLTRDQNSLGGRFLGKYYATSTTEELLVDMALAEAIWGWRIPRSIRAEISGIASTEEDETVEDEPPSSEEPELPHQVVEIVASEPAPTDRAVLEGIFRMGGATLQNLVDIREKLDRLITDVAALKKDVSEIKKAWQ